MTAPAGAKITVAGVADVMLPAETQVHAPRHRDFALHSDRHIQLPQGSNLLVANMFLAIVSALVTIFGIGAEIGIVGVLAVKLSDADTPGHVAGLLVSLSIAVFALCYSTTAIRAIADPQAGSSISAAPGSSFTL